MSAELIAAVLFIIIFGIGVTVGFISVIALSSVRADKRPEQRGPRRPREIRETREPGELADPGDDEVTGASGTPGHWDGTITDDGPRWPRPRDDRDSDLFGG